MIGASSHIGGVFSSVSLIRRNLSKQHLGVPAAKKGEVNLGVQAQMQIPFHL